MFARRPLKKTRLTRRHMDRRLQWAQDHRTKNIRFWRRVHWSDESRFGLHVSDGRIRVWRCSGERELPECVRRTEAFQVKLVIDVIFQCSIDILEYWNRNVHIITFILMVNSELYIKYQSRY